MNEPRFPVPTTVSDEARKFLAAPPHPATPTPADGDIEGWQRIVAGADSYIAQQTAGIELPVTFQDQQISGVHTYVIRPDTLIEEDDEPLFLDIHGGALLFGGGDLARVTGSGTALTSGMLTWSIDYRMPPLHPYPAALDDCLAVYRAALKDRSPHDIFVGGASAGGNLAAALLLRAKDEGLPMPAGLVLLTPEVDLTESGDSFAVLNGVDNVLRPLRELNRLYADGHELSDPYLSPLFGDVTGFPPTFLQSGTRDLFLSNTVLMHRKLRRTGVDAELHVFEAMPHGGFGGTSPEDFEVRAEVRRFLDALRRR